MKKENKPETILKLARQFMESRILLSAVQLNIFSHLDAAPATAADLTGRLQADQRGLTILLDALAAMGLLTRHEDGKYMCTTDAALFLTDKSPRSVLPMIHHATHLWDSWSGLSSRIKKTGLTEATSSADQGNSQLNAFIGAMRVVALPLARKTAAAVLKSGSVRNLIDVGGASGSYAMAFLKASPEIKATIFDRPAVIPIAREHLLEAGLLDRVRLVAGNFYKDELPGGHDLALLSAIIHQNSPVENIELFRKVERSLISGGRIIIRDHVMESGRTKPKEGAIFAVNMLVNTEGGSTYTFDEIETWLTEAGFTNVRLLKSGKHMDALVEACKP
ncbi:MAG: methyltransferase [Smithellaceae bacterium]